MRCKQVSLCYASCVSLMMKSKFCDFKFFSFSVGVPMKRWHCTYTLIPKWLPCGFYSCKVWPNTKPVLTGGSRICSKGGVGGTWTFSKNFDNQKKRKEKQMGPQLFSLRLIAISMVYRRFKGHFASLFTYFRGGAAYFSGDATLLRRFFWGMRPACRPLDPPLVLIQFFSLKPVIAQA